MRNLFRPPPPKKKMPFIFLPRIFFRLANFPLDFFSSDFSASEIGLAFFFPPCQFCIAFLCPENFPRLINSAVFKNKIASLVSLSSLWPNSATIVLLSNLGGHTVFLPFFWASETLFSPFSAKFFSVANNLKPASAFFCRNFGTTNWWRPESHMYPQTKDVPNFSPAILLAMDFVCLACILAPGECFFGFSSIFWPCWLNGLPWVSPMEFFGGIRGTTKPGWKIQTTLQGTMHNQHAQNLYINQLNQQCALCIFRPLHW